MEYLLDNNLPPGVAVRLREAGVASVHVMDIGHRDSADVTIMRLAEERGAVVVTQDNDFPQLLALSRASRPSVILLRPGAPIKTEPIFRLLLSLSQETLSALEGGAVIAIDERGERIRRLPLR